MFLAVQKKREVCALASISPHLLMLIYFEDFFDQPLPDLCSICQTVGRCRGLEMK